MVNVVNKLAFSDKNNKLMEMQEMGIIKEILVA